MNTYSSILRTLSRKYKLLILSCVDSLTAFACWIVFGPPFTAFIASNFEVSLYQLISQNYLNFLIPLFLTYIYFINVGFYRSSIRYSDSRNLIFRSLIGSLIFGLSWGTVYLLEYEIVRNQFLIATILKSIFLAYVFYAFLQISRDIARVIINHAEPNKSGKPVLIYGAGSAGNELYQALKLNPVFNIIGFFDNSKALSGAEINSIKIMVKIST